MLPWNNNCLIDIIGGILLTQERFHPWF